MTKPKKSTLLASAAIALVLVGAGASVINAQTSTTTTSNPMSSLVSSIATKFNLNATDVQNTVDSTMEAERAAHEAEHIQQEAARLAQAVTDGKLTQTQSDLITAKTAELKTQMEAQRTALESWATSNNIPTEYLRFVGGGRGMGGHGGPYQH